MYTFTITDAADRKNLVVDARPWILSFIIAAIRCSLHLIEQQDFCFDDSMPHMELRRKAVALCDEFDFRPDGYPAQRVFV